MSSVCDLGTVRGIIRGVDHHPIHTLLSEMIDDAEHSESRKVFVDINTHDKRVTFGFENSATDDQINKMARWNPTSSIHNTSNISTCGQGMKHYGHRFRGKQIHATTYFDRKTNKHVYMKSSLETNKIYQAAMSGEISEHKFSEVLAQGTSYCDIDDDNLGEEIKKIFNNDDCAYPFNAKTVIVSKNITNEPLLDELSNDEDIVRIEKELINKYYEEIKTGKVVIYIKFPGCEFRELGDSCNTDIIGSTNKQDEHITGLYYVETDFDKLKKGEYIININGTFFRNSKNGNSRVCTPIIISDDDMAKISLDFDFIQYNIKTPITDEEKEGIKKCIVGTSLEDYCGVYLKMGDKFIDSKPIACTLTKRNLQGARLYRGILQLKNPEKTKMRLGIHGLKYEFNLSHMPSLEQIIKQCCIIYKKYCATKVSFGALQSSQSEINPETYCVVKTSNEKSQRTSKPGHNYLRAVGNNFYKFGFTGVSNRQNRIFDSLSDADYKKLKENFPEEEIFPQGKFYYEYLSSQFNCACSTEQKISEYIMELVEFGDVITYDSKVGDGIREYFHCDNIETLNNIKKMMIDSLME